MDPLVSVAMPVYNGERFLVEAIESVLGQTYQNWEFVIGNNCSTDGTLRIAEEYAKRERRIRIENNSRFLDICGNWNNCLSKSQGKYVFGLSSDDVMAADYLEKMVRALEQHPECDVAHAPLRAIDEQSREQEDWWSKTSLFAKSSGELLRRAHVRMAPHDGLLYLSGHSVYITFSQLLIRRSLFDRVGYLESRWGSIGDLNWNMRVTLVSNTVHVPDTWGGWRMHPHQVTATSQSDVNAYWRKIDEMIDDAIGRSSKSLDLTIRHKLESRWAEEARECREAFVETYELRRQPIRRRIRLLQRLLAGSWAARQILKARVSRGSCAWPDSAPELVHAWLGNAGVKERLIPC